MCYNWLCWGGSLCGALVVLLFGSWHLDRWITVCIFHLEVCSTRNQMMTMSQTSCNQTAISGNSQWYLLASPVFFFSCCAAAHSPESYQGWTVPSGFLKTFFYNAGDIPPKKEKGHQYLLTSMNKTSNWFMKLAWEEASHKGKNVYMETKW